MALPLHLLSEKQTKNICCEIHHLSFDLPTVPPGSLNSNVTVKTPITFYEYDRLYVPTLDVDLWTAIINILHGNGYKNNCAINYGLIWIIGNTRAQLNKKRLMQTNTRLISSDYFESFCKDPKVIVERSFLTAKRDSNERRSFIKNYYSRIKKLLPYQNLKLSYDILQTLNEYTSTLLKIHDRDLYLLNNQFYNAKEINQNHLQLLLREVEYTTKKIQNSHVQLLDTLDACSQKINQTIFAQSENKEEIVSYFEQLKEAKRRKKILKYERRHGLGSYHIAQQLKLLKQQMVVDKQKHKQNFNIAKKMLKSWRLSLSRQLVENNLALLFKYNSELRVYLLTQNNKLLDLLYMSKLLVNLRMIQPSQMRDMINKVQLLVEEKYQPMYEKFESAKQMPEEKRIFFIKDTYARFFHKNNIQILNWSLNSIKTIFSFCVDDNRSYARMVQKERELKWQYARNKELLKSLNHDQKDSDKANNQINQSFKETPYFDEAIKLLIGSNHWLIKRIKKYLKGSIKRSTNSHVILFANLAILGLGDYDKYCEEFYKIYRVWKIWPFGTYAWFLNVNWIFNVVLNYYLNITENFVLKSKAVTSFININRNRLRNIHELQKYLGNSSDNNITEIDRFLNRKYYLFTQFAKAPSPVITTVPSYDPVVKFANREEMNEYFKTQYKQNNAYIKSLKFKIKDINDVNKQKMLTMQKDYMSQLEAVRTTISKFKQVTKALFKNVRIVNDAAYDYHFTTSKQIIDVRYIKRFAKANINILNQTYNIVRLFNKASQANIYLNKHTIAAFIRRCEFNAHLNNVGLSPIVFFDNYKELSKSELLRLYLAVQFFTKPNLVIYDSLPLNNEHEYNVVKGILLSEQNRLHFAILFMKMSDQLAKDLALRSLGNR